MVESIAAKFQNCWLKELEIKSQLQVIAHDKGTADKRRCMTALNATLPLINSLFHLGSYIGVMGGWDEDDVLRPGRDGAIG